MLSRRVDLSIQARRPEDAALVTELNELRAERDRQLRRWESREAAREGGAPTDQERQQAQQAIVELEQRVIAGWHRLLVHNADYAREAALWRARPESPRPALDDRTLLLSYFSIRGRVVAFVVRRDGVRATYLGEMAQIERLSRLLALNMRATPGSVGERAMSLEANARHLLGQLYGLLVAPLEADLVGYSDLIVVPHGSLHYLPFHALHDGSGYLLERFTISYLPGAGLLPHIRPAPPEAKGALVLGYSHGGRLPHALSEARAVAAGLGVSAHLEEDASLELLRASIGERRVVHLATHGSFRLDSPLFSGLVLADGWLTTLESFNLRLSASLVTLSACDTGRSRVGAGDDLQGLMRAMLHAGAASLLLSLWTVEDQAAADLMGQLYTQLTAGTGKAAALRHAQRAMIAAGGPRAHPYFWAPFFLVGDTGRL
jgi:CHAT domain-containing protein